MRVFSTLMSWSNENKSCMRVDEDLYESFLNSSSLERALLRQTTSYHVTEAHCGLVAEIFNQGMIMGGKQGTTLDIVG